MAWWRASGPFVLQNKGQKAPACMRGMNGPHHCRFSASQAEERRMEQQTVRKTFKYQLKPTTQQEQVMAFVVRRCRELYNAALEERREAWQKYGESVTVAHQSAQLPAVKEARPEYGDIHSQVLQDVLTRLDRAFQRFFARVKSGEAPGYPRFTAPTA